MVRTRATKRREEAGTANPPPKVDYSHDPLKEYLSSDSADEETHVNAHGRTRTAQGHHDDLKADYSAVPSQQKGNALAFGAANHFGTLTLQRHPDHVIASDGPQQQGLQPNHLSTILPEPKDEPYPALAHHGDEALDDRLVYPFEPFDPGHNWNHAHLTGLPGMKNTSRLSHPALLTVL